MADRQGEDLEESSPKNPLRNIFCCGRGSRSCSILIAGNPVQEPASAQTHQLWIIRNFCGEQANGCLFIAGPQLQDPAAMSDVLDNVTVAVAGWDAQSFARGQKNNPAF